MAGGFWDPPMYRIQHIKFKNYSTTCKKNSRHGTRKIIVFTLYLNNKIITRRRRDVLNMNWDKFVNCRTCTLSKSKTSD